MGVIKETDSKVRQSHRQKRVRDSARTSGDEADTIDTLKLATN